MYLKSWANENKVKEYSLLVPHDNVPIWKEKSIKYTASIDNLYVRQDQGKESDDFEDEFMALYETPAHTPLEKAINSYQLTREDWRILIDYLAAQIVRTPAFYLKLQDQTKEQFPKVTETVAKKISGLSPDQLKSNNPQLPENKVELPIKLDFTGIKAGEDSQYVKITAINGKTAWLSAIRHLLKIVAPVLHQYKWSIITAAEGMCWPTSDDPVLCLNYYGDGDYDFSGGWGRKGSEIIFPVSPTKALYTQIGVKNPSRIDFNREKTALIKRLIVEHSLLYVYSVCEDEEIPQIRPRIVNLEEYQRIKKEFEEWYRKYQNMEVPYLKSY